ncbi:MAG TPA: flagellar basal body L-ring protein FlgH [Geothrix sp.]|nr:flagellar basal body L-ring protein FlgH [Geothrix sp.]
MKHRLGSISGKMIGLAAVLGMAALSPLSGQSLYNEGTYRPLAADNKAFRVGDLITVQVFENSSASTTTDTSTQRNNALNAGAGISTLHNSRQVNAQVGIGGTFDGGGTTQRANKLLVTLSVNVKEVLPNGELQLAGDQLLTVNGEKHKVHLDGRVRTQDISSENVVLSTRLADAHITYVGDGDLSKRQKRAWWRRLADWMGF